MPFKYCPSCGSDRIRFESGKAFRCASCGFTYFHNVATAAGALIVADGRLLCIVRAMEPSSGLLALPGGFVDPGERAEDAVRRECREEIGWEPGELDFLASFPNSYRFANILYNTCDLFFVVPADGLRREALVLDPEEASSVRFIRPDQIDPETLAFDSTRKAVAAYLKTRNDRPARGS